MPANNDYPVLDGISPSWADVIVRASPAGAPLLDVKDIAALNTNASVDVGQQKAGGRVMKRTTGESSFEASWTLYHDGYVKFIRGIKSLMPRRGNQRLITLVHFGIQIQWTPPGSVEIFERRIKGARILGSALNGAEGTDANKIEMSLSPIQIVDMIDGEEVVIL